MTYERLFVRPPAGINALVLEGTRLNRRSDPDDPNEESSER